MATKTDVQKLALTDPIVRMHLDAQRYCRGLAWDEMMCSLVVSLVEAKNAAIALATDYARRMPPQQMTLPPNPSN